jgi:hypothetical protein
MAVILITVVALAMNWFFASPSDFLFALIPYGLCVVASGYPETRVPAMVAATTVLLLDLWRHYPVLMGPGHEQAHAPLVSSLRMLMPLLEVLVAPFVIFLAWLYLSRRDRQVPGAS